MAEIGFYHLTRSSPEQALPKLLGRVLSLPGRAVLLCASEERLQHIDSTLWLSQDPDWLPHGTPATGNADLQPIWITTEDAPAPNGARHLFLMEGAESAHLAEYDRVFDLFDGNDEGAVQAARNRWRAGKAAGHTLAYWQQGPKGWEKKA
ncbi:DNA polymerase III subunit chi [Rhodovarius crocodyli]|uniref:DNA polymerase III subunit chi n=1 Tax=Rhodovarius crocodyli TaxID=1979269 RepID=A0A437MPE7_9PROT|nr:DNA polymerase III subunit chi [Rhodovarius crocodyli]RVT99524.1 DNA polymerase III subunit chi [Rhodovarius crocodyli]